MCVRREGITQAFIDQEMADLKHYALAKSITEAVSTHASFAPRTMRIVLNARLPSFQRQHFALDQLWVNSMLVRFALSTTGTGCHGLSQHIMLPFII